ncbi:hypothetical protein QYE76_039115 [Lolium multiflorum]|uniref:Uncharacterized protein n=1 Tax=Lolium multiflorum TaxID=4521 RepID=A0AAD8TAA7_LOLMU|nr:hypothetical protein QYE76_039115 [Lolium multiflorum]
MSDEPIKYEDLPAEHKKKYDELKAIFEADLIGSFEKTRSHGIRFKGFTPEGAFEGLDLSLPSEERARALRQEINYAVAHSLHRHSESLVNALERVALQVVQEIMKHQYSPSGPALGTYQGEIPFHTRPPLPFAMAAPQQQGSPAYVVYKISAILRDQFGILPKKKTIGYSKPYPNEYDLIPLPPKYRLPDFTKFSGSEGSSSIEHVSRYLAQLGMVSASEQLRVRQRRGETVSEYIQRFRTVKNRCYSVHLSKKEAVELAVAGLAAPLKDLTFQVEYNSLAHMVQRLTSYEQRHPELYQDKFKRTIGLVDAEEDEDHVEDQEIAMAEWTRTPVPVSCKWVKQPGPPRGFDFDLSKTEQIFDMLLKEKQLKLPEGHKIPTSQEMNGRPYCKWHHTFTHATNDCKVLRAQIQIAIESGRLIFGQFAMKVDTQPFPGVNMVDLSHSLRREPGFSFGVNMAGLGTRHGDDKAEAHSRGKKKEEADPRDRPQHDNRRIDLAGDGKLGYGFTSADELEEIDIGPGDKPRPTFISKKLDPHLRGLMIALLKEYPDCFAWDYTEMPGLDRSIIEHRLPLKKGFRPFQQRARQMKAEILVEVKKEIQKMLDAGFIRTCRYAEWISNVVPVEKKDGRWRVTIDFRNLNSATPKDEYPMPVAETLINAAAGHKILSFMDGNAGYNQIFMAPEDIHKTAFRVPGSVGLFEYVVMTFGLKNAGATYQRAMNYIFHDLIGKLVEIYIDDVVVKSVSMDGHLEDLRHVLDRTRKFGLRMNPKKCAFGVTAGQFLGFLVHERGIEIGLKSQEAVRTMKPPTTKKELQCLIGKINFVRRFGIPQTITTDGGSVFVSKEMKKFCDDMGIKLIRSSPYYAQANGQAEASNKSLIKLIKRKIDEHPRRWHEVLSEALWAYRMSCHGAIKTSPYQLVYGQEAVLPWEIKAGSRRITFQNDLTAEEYAALMSDIIEDATELRLWSLEKIKENKAKVARAYNKKVKPKEFQVGDLVWEAVLPLGTKDKVYGKWSPNWHGPYKVVQVLKGNAYMLEQLDGVKFPVAVNGQHLKKYFPSMWDDGQ